MYPSFIKPSYCQMPLFHTTRPIRDDWFEPVFWHYCTPQRKRELRSWMSIIISNSVPYVYSTSPRIVLPEISAVYVVANPFPKIIYVGASKNIKLRFYGHTKKFRDMNKCEVGFMPCRNKLRQMERILIWALNPLLNLIISR